MLPSNVCSLVILNACYYRLTVADLMLRLETECQEKAMLQHDLDALEVIVL